MSHLQIGTFDTSASPNPLQYGFKHTQKHDGGTLRGSRGGRHNQPKGSHVTLTCGPQIVRQGFIKRRQGCFGGLVRARSRAELAAPGAEAQIEDVVGGLSAGRLLPHHPDCFSAEK